MSKPVTTKPPILWLQTILFASTLLIALIAVPWYGISHGYHWGIVISCLLVMWANGLSITAGYHRLWAHNAYKAHPALKLFFALFGAAATQNSILIWSSGHRRHHRHVDDLELDPYSARKGLWFSHIGWMLREYDSAKEDFSNAKDLMRDPIVMWQHRHYLPLVLAMNLLPAIIVGAIFHDLWGSLLLVGVLRLVIGHHCTFFINSLAHFWGRQPYTDENTARDNGLLAMLTYGEGYHNFHHLFQTDYRNGVRWWQFDPTKWLIYASSWVGLSKDLNRTPNFKIHRAIVGMQLKKAEQKLAKLKHSAEWSQNWREILDREYHQFTASLSEWNELRQQWYQQKRQQLAEATQEISRGLNQKWEQTALHTRFKELDYALEMQRKRLSCLLLQLATPQSA